MRTSAAGSEAAGFTLIELLVVVAIVAMASAGVSFALRDSAGTQLERDAQRLSALLESGRAQSRATGVAVRWTVQPGGFRFDGLPPQALPQQWLGAGIMVIDKPVLLLGPEPIIGRQEVLLSLIDQPGRVLHVGTDGVRPFAVTAQALP